MAKFVIYLLIWLAQAILITLIVDDEWVEEQLSKEILSVKLYLGNSSSQELEDSTKIIYKELFVDSGVIQGMYHLYIPVRSKEKTGMENILPSLFIWIEQRFDAFWWLVYQAIFRLQVISQWLPYLLPLLAASLIDGLVSRKIKKVSGGSANSVRYHAASNIMLISLILPFLFLSLPIAMSPLVVPLWFIMVASNVSMFTSNVQHRI